MAVGPFSLDYDTAKRMGRLDAGVTGFVEDVTGLRIAATKQGRQSSQGSHRAHARRSPRLRRQPP